LYCFKCDKTLEPAFAGEDPGPPDSGLVFASYGSYGSTVYDPVGNAPGLVIFICDDCMLKHQTMVLMRRVERPEPRQVYEPWNPDFTDPD
jgi:hypothetical protein